MERSDAVREIESRGGETSITGQYGTVRLDVEDHRDGLLFLRAAGWRQYSRRFGARRASLAYLCGESDAGPWAVRVPGTCCDTEDALDWLEPAEVTKARDAGRRVRRQGDIYAVETRQDRTAETAAAVLPDSHEWRPQTRHLVHRPEDGRKHRPLRVSFPAKFVQQRAYRMGRSGRTGSAD